MTRTIFHGASAEETLTFAAERIVAIAKERVAAHGRFILGIAGGSTPLPLYRLLTSEHWRSQIPWEHTIAIWGDERYVAHDHPDSNYRTANEALLKHVPIKPNNVYAVPTFDSDIRDAANAYEIEMRTLLQGGDGKFDCMLLGIGNDGHTASLFPGNEALHAPANRLVVAVDNAPMATPERISLSITALNRSHEVIFFVTGASKAKVVRNILQGEHDPEHLPAQFIDPPEGNVTWILDAEAASLLE